jgi:putative cell wall-binding protein
VSGNGTYTSDSFTPSAAGTYTFTAAYGGNGSNAASSDACGAAGESVTVPAPGAGPNVVAGPNRDQTAVAASQLTFPANGSANAVILARNDLFADSLPGSRLATAKNGPLLLTPPTSLDAGTEAEMRRVLPAGGTVYILGGTDAISQAVENQVRADGFNVVRDGGLTRFETAVLIAQSDQQAGAAGLSTPTSPIFVATGLDFPDGLTAGVAASAVNGVVLLSVGTAPSAATTQYIQSHPGATVYAVGGQAAAAYPNATPIVGATRYETAAALAQRFFPSPTVVGIATGLNFPDALSGGAAMGKLGGPLLLTDPNTLSTATQQYLTAHKSTIKTEYVFGGDAAVSPTVRSQITAALS